jgi:acetolactate synthase-1/2/3 large subunit
MATRKREATQTNLRTGGEILVETLKTHGVDTIFCVPGESYLGTLDALYDARDDIRLVVCRQEGGAANMADAYGKLTGKPGVCFVTRGPGAANAAVGIHTAYQDSTPVVLFIGQVARDMVEREAFQEVDFRRMYGQLTKWVAQVDDPARLPELVTRAFQTAVSGRPGPVALALPEDMQTERAAAPEVGRYREVQPHPGAADMAGLRAMLARARRPLLVVGGSPWTEAACADIAAFAEANDLPVIATYRRQDLIDNRRPHYIGVLTLGTNPALVARINEADLLLVAGPQLGEIVTNGYTLLEVPRPRQKLIHVAAGVAELGKVYQADLPINSGPAGFAAAARALAPVPSPPWAEWRRQARAAYEAYCAPQPAPGAVNMAEIVAWLDERLPDDAIIANGAGNFTVWVHRFFRYRRFRTQLAPQSGAMGYGVPAGVAAAIVHPDRIVVSFSGDGCFLMCGQELATAVQYRLKVIFVVVNNAMYGTIRMHQERRYPARVSGTDLVNPDFAAYARAFGASGETVTKTADFAPAFERALAGGGPTLIEIRVDPEAILPTATIAGLRKAAGG